MENLENWKKAGNIAAQAREYGYKLIKEDELLINVIEKIEEFILKKGAKSAFPTQISLNEIAAHYTSSPEDKTTFKKGDLAKLDIGVHIEGCIGDTAITKEITTTNNQELIKASKEALKNALKITHTEIEIREIGKEINKTISSFGFTPIKNLSGHEIKEYNVHAGLTIPNYDNNDKTTLKENQVIAIEPFATTGNGFIKEGKPSTIFRLTNPKPVRNTTTRKLLEHIKKEYQTLPFSKRQLSKQFKHLTLPLHILQKEQILYHYPLLPESSQGLVSQAEHTIIIKEKPIILTKI